MADIKGLREDGTLPSVARAEVERMIAEAAPVVTPAAPPVQRLTLTADTALDTSAWDRDQVVALVVTQDATGGHVLSLDGEDVPVDPAGATITAWVWDGARWAWHTSATPATPAPAWPSGMTVTVGDPTDTDVAVVFSQPVPATAVLQWRAGAADSWRALPMETETTATITGLAPSTAYPAPEFRMVTETGESSVIAAQAFTTPAPPPGWKVIRRATFTTATEIPLASYTPEVGPKLVQSGDPATVTVTGGQTAVYYSGTNYAKPTALWSGLENGDKKLRITCDYIGAVGGNQEQWIYVRTNASPYFLVRFNAAIINDPYTPGGTVRETTGKTTLPPSSGTAVLTADGDTITLAIDGTVYRSWVMTWPSSVTNYTGAEVTLGGGDLHQSAPTAVSGMAISELTVEAWK